MQNQTDTIVVPPAPKAVRGFSSSLDVSDMFILTFNANSVIFRPHQHPQKSLVLNHVSDVVAARFSHDGRLAASIDAKGTLIISEPIPDRIIQVYQYDNVFPNAKYLDWSADKKKVCIVGEGKTKFGKVISIDTGITAGDIGSISATVNSCSFRPERPYKLVMGGDELQLKCFQGPPYNFVKSDKSHAGFINHIRYSTKGTYIVSGGADRKLVLYDGKSYQRLGQKQNAHNGSIFGLDWIDDQHFVTVSSDKLIKIWNTKFEEKQTIEGAFAQDMNSKNYGFFLVAVRAFKDRIYVCNIDGDVMIYCNPLSGKKAELLHTYPGNRAKIVKMCQFGSDNLILLDMGGRVLSCNLSSHEVSVCATEIQMHFILNGFVNGERLFVMTNNGAVWLYEGPSPRQLKLVKMSDKTEFKHICRSPKPEHLTGITNNKLLTYDVEFEKVINEVAVTEDVTCLASNDQYILAGTIKGTVLLFNQDFKLLQQHTLNTFKITTLAFFETQQPCTYRCLMGDACGKMSMVQISQHGIKAVKQTMGGHNSVITGAASDGTKLYTFSMDGKICIWNNEKLFREGDIKDSVNGGILGGLCIGGYLAVTGNDMVTKLFGKGS